jgi:hypothetical protein
MPHADRIKSLGLTGSKKGGLFPLPPPWQGAIMQSGLIATLLSIMMLAAFLLAGGGIWLIWRRREKGKGILMLVAALVLFGNVLVWTI